MKQVIEGVGFGVGGPEDNYLLLIDDAGNESTVTCTKLVPDDGTTTWAHMEALLEGFSDAAFNKGILEREDERRPRPYAYRIRISIEHERLSREETQALLQKGINKRKKDDDAASKDQRTDRELR